MTGAARSGSRAAARRQPARAAAPRPRTSRETGVSQYSAPRYYEIAFDMNRKQEVEFLVHCFRTYARRPIRTVVDLACGTGPHLIRLARLGYRMTGLDLSPENVAFLAERAAEQDLDVSLVRGDMTRFQLPRPVDAAICMQDSQGHLLTNEAITAHLRCVAAALRRGGLYVFDRYMCSSWVDPARRWTWTRRRGRATVRATFETLRDLNPVTQVFFEDMELTILEDGARRVYRQRHPSRMVFPQELRALVALAGGFEMVEWFYGFKPHLKLDRAHHPLLMVVVLRRT
jgi:SAM-dependent methyltransferase